MSGSLGAALRFLRSLSLRTCSLRAVPSGGQPSKEPDTAETAGVVAGVGMVAVGTEGPPSAEAWQPQSARSRVARARDRAIAACLVHILILLEAQHYIPRSPLGGPPA